MVSVPCFLRYANFVSLKFGTFFIASLDSFFCIRMSSMFTMSSDVGYGEGFGFPWGGACFRTFGFSRSPYDHIEVFVFIVFRDREAR